MNTKSGRLSLFLEYRRALVDYAAPIVGDRARAEDIVQDAFTRFVPDRHAKLKATVVQPIAYLYKIVRNLAMDVQRNRAREAKNVVEGFDATAVVADPAASPEAALGLRQEARILESALAELPERTRIALEMHRLDGAKLREIADHLGISVSLAHGLVTDGLAHCRDRLRRAT